MAPVNNRLVQVPLLHQLTDKWREQELNVVRVLLLHEILH